MQIKIMDYDLAKVNYAPEWRGDTPCGTVHYMVRDVWLCIALHPVACRACWVATLHAERAGSAALHAERAGSLQCIQSVLGRCTEC